MKNICGRDFPVEMGGEEKRWKKKGITEGVDGRQRLPEKELIHLEIGEDKREKLTPKCWTHWGEEKKLERRELKSDSDQPQPGVTHPPQTACATYSEEAGSKFQYQQREGAILQDGC